MSGFSDAPWSHRFGILGDAAESKCIEYLDGKCERFGLDRPEGVHVPSLPARVRGAPDFITTSLDGPAFVEAKGLGRAQHLQIKLEAYGVLHFWRMVMPVWVFVWDSHRKRRCLISMESLDKLINTPDLCSLSWFDGSKMVWRIPADSVFDAAER